MDGHVVAWFGGDESAHFLSVVCMNKQPGISHLPFSTVHSRMSSN